MAIHEVKRTALVTFAPEQMFDLVVDVERYCEFLPWVKGAEVHAKNERDLEGFDTKLEWIRLLQPEFDPVHLFQIWNKAYNISVQMASMGLVSTATKSAPTLAQARWKRFTPSGVWRDGS